MDEDCMQGIQKVIKGRLVAIAGRENEIELKTEEINKSREDYATVNESLKKGIKIREILDKQRSEINSRITANNTEIRNHVQYMNKLTLLKQKRDSYVLEMAKEDDNSVVDRQKADLLQTETELSNIRLDLDVKAKKLEVLNHVKVLYSDQGIRRSILGNIVTLFNNNVNLYLRRLEAPCTVEFDDTFNYTMKTLGGIEIPYGSLSGGESLRVTTALAFTFKDILRIQNQISFSVSIYDEWFDVAIDERGLEVVGEILSERKDKYGEIPYIITHRTQLQIEDAQSLTVVKENNTSRIEQ
jgi:hypothetical protein